MMIVAGTGHRPEACEPEAVVRKKVRDVFTTESLDVFITGLAAGYDLWAADEALALGIDVWAARPWSGHGAREEDVSLYARVVEGASRVVNVVESEEYLGPWVYHKRNHWMVDNAAHVLAYLNPSVTSGGTYQCVQYAIKKEIPIRNIYGQVV